MGHRIGIWDAAEVVAVAKSHVDKSRTDTEDSPFHQSAPMPHKSNTSRSAPTKEPYTVEQYPACNGGVFLVGYDGAGRLKIETRVEDVTEDDVDDLCIRIRNWVMARDNRRPTRVEPFLRLDR